MFFGFWDNVWQGYQAQEDDNGHHPVRTENVRQRLSFHVCRKYCPRFRSGHAGKRSPAEGDAFLRYNYFREVEVISFANPFAMDILTFEGNMRSRSYALTPEDADYEFFMTELRDVFERHAINGIVNEMQETQIYFGCF